jgi:hypothetical protein
VHPKHEDIIVDARLLGETLRRLQKLGGRTPGPGILRATPGALEVEWKGGAEILDADGSSSFAVRVDAKVMAALAGTLTRDGKVRVCLRGPDRIAFDTFVARCVLLSRETTTGLLPVQATPYDVLMLAYRHSANEIRDAGLEREVQEARASMEQSLTEAAEALAWLGVRRDLLATWLEAHLAAVASGKPTFDLARTVLVDGDGQLGLFSDP